MGKLTVKEVAALKAAKRHQIGDGLYLDVSAKGGRSWLVRVEPAGKRRDNGGGSARLLSLADARTAALHIKRQMLAGLDPVAERRAVKKLVPTFKVAAVAYHAEHAPTWRNDKHAAQVLSSLESYAFPTLGDYRVDAIELPDVRGVLDPIWLAKPETARRVRQRIGAVLDWAVGQGYRAASLNVASLSKSLPRQPKTDNHFEAMPWAQVPGFIRGMHASPKGSETVKLALEFLILTAARPGEVRGALWSEIDGAVWRIPAERMKGNRPHNVPLTPRAVAILERMAELRPGDAKLIWPGQTLKKPISDMTLKAAMKRMGLTADPHGFRSSFRDWVSEATSHPESLAEAALSHAKGDKTEAAYARSDMLDKRRALMEDWAVHCGG